MFATMLGNDANNATLHVSSTYQHLDWTVFGFGGNDNIRTGERNDIIYAGSGNDTVSGGTGSNYIDGGTGYDLVDYSFYVSASANGMHVDLASGAA